ncbi:hypothetical protein G4G28_10555 [Massilia sp. Dwa41.01b]|uniref:hypothetical protein n=1 Tax=Massilia sp. Dwa41.01b TaxID=2709302 RepID=UPI0015FF62A8|nr:hypothetical protein [Massilia sp. Dwa41.01b]QNA88821.1 hypothetical protein G4G28_10555 [Massilia sp. Dwa41.01b]
MFVPPPADLPEQADAAAAPGMETAQANAAASDTAVTLDLGGPTANTSDSTAPSASTLSTRLPGDLLASSRRMAGRIDRELRKGGSPITAEPDRKWQRFAEAVAGAHAEPGGAVTLARYTAPDGVTIYRKTVGSRVRCYRSGSVGGLGPADGRSAGVMADCPVGVSWTRL